MYLKRLEIHGFKSFANKTVLEFENGITAVVGPNGSGKSNVGESIRWVLGEQSAKLLRGKKADDVIFAGSDKKARMGFADVNAIFDNSDKRIPLDAAEVSIQRRVDRNGNSDYLINGAKVRLQDIVELVLKSGIGTSRYTVIGQGTIDQLILAGPSEIKNLLDEASGIKSYHIKREKTLRRLESTIDNLSRSQEVVAEIEPRLRMLRRQVKKMEEREVYETELKTLLFEDYSFTVKQYTKEISELQIELSGLESKASEKQTKIEQILGDIRQHTEQLTQFSPKQKSLQDKIAELQIKKQNISEQIGILKGKLETGNLSGEDPAVLASQLSGLEQQILNHNQAIETFNREIAQIQKALDEKQAIFDELTENFTKLYNHAHKPHQVSDINTYKQFVVELDAEFNSFWSILESSSLEEIRESGKNLKAAYDRFKHAVARPNDEDERQEALTKLNELLAMKDKIGLEVSALRNKLTIESSKREYQQSILHTLDQEKLHLETRLATAKDRSGASQDQLRISLMDEQSKLYEDLKGISAKLADLERELQIHAEQENKIRQSMYEQENASRQVQHELTEINNKLSFVNVNKAKQDTRYELLKEEIIKSMGSDITHDLLNANIETPTSDRTNKIERLRRQLDLIGGVDETVMTEYNETNERYEFLTHQIADLNQSLGDLKSTMDELDKHIKAKFNQAFTQINDKFEYYFRVLFQGGRAFLVPISEKTETEDEGEEGTEEVQEEISQKEKLLNQYKKSFDIIGVDIKATPPGKKLSNIQALSGGERSLTAIALLCSLLSCFPSPVVVLDEVDAALDDANTIRFGEIIGSLVDKTQFVTITHNRETMSRSKILYGVTMGDDGVSKILSVKLDQAKAYAK